MNNWILGSRTQGMLALVMVLGMMLAACAPTAPTSVSQSVEPATEATAPAVEEAATGESLLRFGYSQRPNNFNPLDVVQGIEGFTQKWVNAKLVTFDGQGQLMGDLAESWTISDDGTVFTFTLREGVTWQDGEPFTADDVVFTFDRILTPAMGARLHTNFLVIDGAEEFAAGEADSVSGIEALSDTEVQFTLKEPSAIFLVDMAITNGHTMLPKHVLESVAPEAFATSEYATRRPYPGLGPYIFDKYETDQYFDLVANPNYFRGAPKIDRIRIQIIPDNNTRVVALENGEVDMIQNIPLIEYNRILGLEGVNTITQVSPSPWTLFVDSDQSKEDPKNVATAHAGIPSGALSCFRP